MRARAIARVAATGPGAPALIWPSATFSRKREKGDSDQKQHNESTMPLSHCDGRATVFLVKLVLASTASCL